MTVEELINKLKELKNQKADIFIWDPCEEVSAEIATVKDIHEPSDNKEYFIVVSF